MRSTEENDVIWRQLVDSHVAWSRAQMDFFAEGVDRVGLLRSGLRGKDRMTAVVVAPFLKVPELMPLFPELVNLARALHSPFEAAWDLILSLPRDWVLAHIE